MLSSSNILLLEKLIYLGKRLEGRKFFKLLEPWSFNGYDVIEVQNVGKKISTYIGLPNLTFIINYTQQGKKTAGHIELNNNSDEGVFIEIDEKFKSENDIILAILAHEICHKLIHFNGLTQFGYENEILTDAATVFTGLGKLSLNGCEEKKVITETKRKGNEQTTTTTTTNQTVGYLKREQFAFLYNVVCNMRKIPKEDVTKGLNYSALNAISSNQYDHIEDLFNNDYALRKVNDTLSQFNHQYQIVSAKNLKLIKTLQSNFKAVNEFNKATHKKIKLTNEKYLTKASENFATERLNYIKNLILVNDLNGINRLYDDEINDLSSLNDAIIKMVQVLNGKFLINLIDREILYNFNCHVCEKSMRLRQDKLVKINCTKCKYSFIIDNSIIETIKYKDNTIKTKKSLRRKLNEIIAIIME